MIKQECEVQFVHKDKVDRIRRKIQDDDLINRMAEIFRILSDPARMKIVICLEMEELCVCDIEALTKISQSSVSHHLKILRQMNIVRFRRDGKMTFYALSDSHIPALLAIARDHTLE